MNSNYILKAQNLSIGFERVLIKNLNFELKLGERLIIYGSNGTGKSTLLSSLLNNTHQKMNQVQWSIPHEQILFLQQQGVFHSQTPDDVESYLLNILLYKSPLASVKQEDLNKVKEVRAKLHLPNLLLKNLSGGQRQKLKIARSFLMKTRALLLDEPFNSIDQVSTQELIQWLNASQKDMIQILVLHDFEQIENLKSKILWIQPGAWEILEFHDWFQKIDRRFHSWMHTTNLKNNSPQQEIF